MRPKITARIARNRVEIESERTGGISVLLSFRMFDPKRPVTVLLNGETRYQGIPQPDPAALLESIMENLDPEQVFTHRIDL